MSTESFKSFMARVSADEALRQSLREMAPEGMSAEQLSQAASAHGFSFSASEVSKELSDAELDGVAGGFGFSFGSIGHKWSPIMDKQSPIGMKEVFVANSIFKF